MGIFKKLKSHLKFFKIDSSNESKIAWLRKEGCLIGEGTKLICSIKAFGTEPYLISVGKNCLITADVNLFTHDGGICVLNHLNYFDDVKMDKMGRIIIGDNVYIGGGAKILPGVSIGNNCIIGAGAIVTHDIPDNSCAVGVPAKVVSTVEEYFNRLSGRVYPTGNMSYEEKKEYLLKHIK